MSAADLTTGLLFGDTFRFKVHDPEHPDNDRLTVSRGNNSPLFTDCGLVAVLSTVAATRSSAAGTRPRAHPSLRGLQL
jgi:transketolase